MSKALQAAGHTVIVITTNKGAIGMPSDQWMQTNAGKIIYHSARFHHLPLKLLSSVIRSVRSCDIVHLNSIFYPPSLVSALIARWAKKPVVWSPRGEFSQQALKYHHWRKIPYVKLVRKLFLSKVIFHSTSPEETRQIREAMGNQARVIEIPNFLELPSRFKPEKTSPYLLYIGRIHPVKALENLLLSLLDSNRFLTSDYRLKIAGDSENAYGKKLKDLVRGSDLEHRIEFVGHVESEEKQKLYASAYFTILPSHSENFGNVVLESLAQGTPVIASKGTPWGILETEKAGLWVSNEPHQLRVAIEFVLNLNESTYDSYRSNSLQAAHTHFDVHRNIHKWIKAYKVLLS